MLRRMNIRKDKLVDIQAALATDGGDKQVDFDEWRTHLKTFVPTISTPPPSP